MRHGRRQRRTMFLSALTLALACGGPSGAPPCERGDETCDCHPNDTCNGELLCLSGRCVALEDATGGQRGSGGSAAAEGGETSSAGSDSGGETAGGETTMSGGNGEQAGASMNPASGGSIEDQGGTVGSGGSRGGTTSSGGQTPEGGVAGEATSGAPSTGGTPSAGGAQSTGGAPSTGGSQGTGGTMLPPDCTPVAVGPLSPGDVRSSGFPEGETAYYDFTGTSVDCDDCVTPCTDAGGSTELCEAYLCNVSSCEYDYIWIDVDMAAQPDNDSDPTGLAARLTNVSGNYQDHLLASDFGFEVPADATVVGVELGVRRGVVRSSGFPVTVDQEVLLLLEGQAAGENRAKTPEWSSWSSSISYVAYGAQADAWGLDLTGADVSSDGFGVAISAGHPQGAGVEFAYVDHVQMTVHYCE